MQPCVRTVYVRVREYVRACAVRRATRCISFLISSPADGSPESASAQTNAIVAVHVSKV